MNDSTPQTSETQKNNAPHLLEEPPILVYPTLAVYMGINKAVVFQQLHFLQSGQKTANNQYNLIDNRWWVYNSYQQWKDQYFPWLSVSSLKGIFIELEKVDKLILSRQSVKSKSDRRKWYSIDYEAWVSFCTTMRQKLSDGGMGQKLSNGGMGQKLSNGSSDKNYPIKGQKVADGYSETSSETSSKTLNTNTPHTPAPNGLGSNADPTGIKGMYEKLQAEADKQKLLPAVIDGNLPIVTNAATPLTPSSAPPPSPPDVFDLTQPFDAIAMSAFEFKRPSQLELKSYQADKRRIYTLVDITADTYPELSDSEQAAEVIAFYKDWGTKRDKDGKPLNKPTNGMTYGRNLRIWAARPSRSKLKPVTPVIEDDEPLEPVKNPVWIGGQNVNAA